MPSQKIVNKTPPVPEKFTIPPQGEQLQPATVQFDPEHVLRPYGNYIIVHSYAFKSGLVQVPVAAGPAAFRPYSVSCTPCRVLQAHAPICTHVVNWTATRALEPPYLPKPDPLTTNEVLLSAFVNANAPDLDTDGQTAEYSFSGVYTYAVLCAPWTVNGLVMGGWRLGRRGYAAQDPSKNVMPTTRFVDGIL